MLFALAWYLFYFLIPLVVVVVLFDFNRFSSPLIFLFSLLLCCVFYNIMSLKLKINGMLILYTTHYSYFAFVSYTHTHDDGDNVFDFYLFSFYLYLGRLLRRFRVPVSCINFPYRISKWMKIAFIFLVLLIHDVSISMNIIYWSCMRVCVCVYKWMSGFIPTNRQTRMKKKHRRRE